LSRQAREIIDSVPRAGTFLFGRAGNTPFGGWSWSKARLDKLVPLPAWRVHDIRRSVATHMAERGFAQPHVVEAVLGHLRSGSQAGVAGVYVRTTYAPEQRLALQAWADNVGYPNTSQNVVNLKRAAHSDEGGKMPPL
jgi:integrase